MFNIPFPLDKTLDEAVITEVDIKRFSCKAKTLFGKNLTNVRWVSSYGGSGRGGDRGSPSIGDNVVITYGLGYPLIFGFVSKVQSVDEGEASTIGDGIIPDTGNFSGVVGSNAGVDVNKPADMVVGDKVFQTFGGAMLALLRGGSVLIRSNRFSEIFLSKYLNLVRIVSGNWEHFTDVFSDVVKNYSGRVYRYVGYTNTYQKSKSESYDYHEYTGDTALAEYLKTNYNRDTTPPVATTTIKKEQVLSSGGTETMRRTLSLDGTNEVVITGTVNDVTTFTRVKQDKDKVYISFNDTSFIQMDTTSIIISKDTTTKATFDATGVHIVEAGGSSVDMTSGVITATDSAGAIAKLNAGDITLHNSAGSKVDITGTSVTVTGISVLITDGAGSNISLGASGITLHSALGGTVAITAATAVS